MGGPEHVSRRLVEQRLRNRAMEALATLSDGDEGVRRIGVNEYINQFFDVIDDEVPWQWREWSCFTPEEVAHLDAVHGLLIAACGATPSVDTDEGFITSGWPTQIQPAAVEALGLLQQRGRFREDAEEATPTA